MEVSKTNRLANIYEYFLNETTISKAFLSSAEDGVPCCLKPVVQGPRILYMQLSKDIGLQLVILLVLPFFGISLRVPDLKVGVRVPLRSTHCR